MSPNARLSYMKGEIANSIPLKAKYHSNQDFM